MDAGATGTVAYYWWADHHSEVPYHRPTSAFIRVATKAAYDAEMASSKTFANLDEDHEVEVQRSAAVPAVAEAGVAVAVTA